MFENDIKLDYEGNTVVSNGDMTLTETDAEFITRMLTCPPGSWELYPTIGVRLTKFIGTLSSQVSADAIKREIVNAFSPFGMYPIITVLPFSIDGIAMKLNFNIIGANAALPMSLTFALNSGVVMFYDTQKAGTTTYTEIPNTKTTQNKYLKRRLQ